MNRAAVASVLVSLYGGPHDGKSALVPCSEDGAPLPIVRVTIDGTTARYVIAGLNPDGSLYYIPAAD